MAREFVRDKESGLFEIMGRLDRKKERFNYCLRDKNNQSEKGLIKITPKYVHPAILIRVERMGDAGGYGEIDSKDLKNKCPRGCNAYLPGEGVQFESAPTIHIKDNDWRSHHPLGDKDEIRRGFRLVNFCRISIPK